MELTFTAQELSIDSDMEVTAKIDDRDADSILSEISSQCSISDLMEAVREHLDDDEIFNELDDVDKDELMKRLSIEEVIKHFDISADNLV